MPAAPAPAGWQAKTHGSGGSSAHRGSAGHIHRLLVLRHVARPHPPLLADRAIGPAAGSDHALAGLQAGRGAPNG